MVFVKMQTVGGMVVKKGFSWHRLFFPALGVFSWVGLSPSCFMMGLVVFLGPCAGSQPNFLIWQLNGLDLGMCFLKGPALSDIFYTKGCEKWARSAPEYQTHRLDADAVLVPIAKWASLWQALALTDPVDDTPIQIESCAFWALQSVEFFPFVFECRLSIIYLNTCIFFSFFLLSLFFYLSLYLALNWLLLSSSDLLLATDVTAEIYSLFYHSCNSVHFVGPCERSSLETEGATCSRDSSSGMRYSNILWILVFISFCMRFIIRAFLWYPLFFLPRVWSTLTCSITFASEREHFQDDTSSSLIA